MACSQELLEIAGNDDRVPICVHVRKLTKDHGLARTGARLPCRKLRRTMKRALIIAGLFVIALLLTNPTLRDIRCHAPVGIGETPDTRGPVAAQRPRSGVTITGGAVDHGGEPKGRPLCARTDPAEVGWTPCAGRGPGHPRCVTQPEGREAGRSQIACPGHPGTHQCHAPVRIGETPDTRGPVAAQRPRSGVTITGGAVDHGGEPKGRPLCARTDPAVVGWTPCAGVKS